LANPPKTNKTPVNYKFLAKLYNKVGQEIDKKNQNSISSDKQVSKIISRRKVGDELIIGTGHLVERSLLKESQIVLPKVHTQKESSALVPYEEKLD
jgi:hypothetical protein